MTTRHENQNAAAETAGVTESDSELLNAALSQALHPYQLFMFVLGLYVLLALACQTFLKLDESTQTILNVVDDCVCLVFFFDFWCNLYFAPNKWAYLKWGWLDLLSSLPTLDVA